jgi:hypothetical protein
LTVGHCPSSCCPAVSRCLRHRGLPRLSRDTPPPKRSPRRIRHGGSVVRSASRRSPGDGRSP